ncbi:MAG: YIP1 family protein [Chloroflexi bacterium]|nr:YIP1 family protein [Chloroflexota bacterium]
MFNRIIGALSFNAATYREVANDLAANRQAALIVSVVSFLAGFVSAFTFTTPDGQGFGATEVIIFSIASAIVALIAWGISAFIAVFIATALLGGKTSMGEMLRIGGYASVFNILGIVPILGIAGWILLIIATIIGINQVIAFGARRAIATAVIAGALRFIAMYLLLGIVLVGLIWSLALTAR